MSENAPFMHLTPKCPKCGENLSIKILGTEPSNDDLVFCEACVFEAGTRREVFEHIRENNRDEIANTARDEIAKLLKKSLGKL